MPKKNPRKKKNIPIPLLWLVCSWLCAFLFGVGLFFFILKKSGVSFPIAAGQSTDPFFFAFLTGVLAPVLLQVFVIMIMRGIVHKRSAAEIAKEVVVTGAGMVASTLLDALSSSNGSKDNRSSSGSGDKGGGGSFGGGGASGGY